MKFRVGVKLGLGFGLVLLLMSISAALTYFRLADIRQTTERMMQVRVPTLDAARRLSDNLNDSASKARQTILAGTEPARKEAAQKTFEAAWSRVDKDVAKLDEL